MLKIGSHVGMSAPMYLLGAANEANSYGANTFMIYTGPPQNTRRKSVEYLRIKEAHEFMDKIGIAKEDVIVHAPYIMNLANGELEKREYAVDFLTREVERTAAIGAKYIVLHPGAHLKEGSDVGIERIIKGLDEVFARSDNNVSIALETMSGKGSEVGRNFEELRDIITGSKYSDRLSVCFDTCHVHDYGYDIISDYDKVIEEFDRIVGIDKIKVFHINDSKNPTKSHKDRHENLGIGHIGFEALLNIIYDERFKDVPKILETPWVEVAGKKVPPYFEEISMIKNKKFVNVFK